MSGVEQDERVVAIVAAALQLKPEERAPYLQSACGMDHSLYEETLEAVEWEQRMGAFLQHPIIPFWNSPHSFEPGEIISDRFEIVRKIGEGGMAMVYEAFDRKRNQAIAIKAAKSGFGRLLSPELESALRVRHPNVCLVNEIHTTQTSEGEVDFLTMELLDGETLSARLLRVGKIPRDEAAEIARQLCAGLKAAHRSDVIHRDLKAGNVILCRDNQTSIHAVITDFGLSGESGHSGYFGTPRYLAPELLLGQKASKASDIYALGVILYEMVAGLTLENAPAEPKAHTGETSRPYQRLVAEFLSLEPARRSRAFNKADEELQKRAWSRRALLTTGVGTICALAGGTWMEREKLENWLNPLPRKRFIALCAWPPAMDDRANPIVRGVLEAIENELARAEAADRNLLVVSSHYESPNMRDPVELRKFAESLGANLILEASGVRGAQEFKLLLKVLDAYTSAVLRQRQVVCAMPDISLLAAKTVAALAGLLDIHWDADAAERLQPSTDSSAALKAFQEAEELRRKPNDDGLTAAIESYKQAINADDGYSDAYGRLAIAYCRLYALKADPGALELARANADRTIQLNGQSVNGHLALAEVYKWRGNLEGALQEIHRALQLDPANPRTLLWQAQLYQKFKKWNEAEQTYRRLQKERPNYWLSYQELGILLAAQGRYKEANKAFQAASVAAPGSADVFNNMGALQIRLGNLPQAEENYRRSLAIKRNALACLNLSEALRIQAKNVSALALAKDAVRLAPFNDQCWLGLGDCYDAIGDQGKWAIEAYRSAAVELDRRLQTDSSDGSDWIRLALYRLKSHSGQNVSTLIKRSEEHGQLDVDSELIRARVLELLGRRKEALAVIAACLGRGTTRFEIASIRDFKALRIDPGYARILDISVQQGNN